MIKREVEFTCPDCGKKHTLVLEGHYFIPGISGTLCGEVFVDPTADRYCRDCLDKKLIELGFDLSKEKEKDNER